MTAAPGRCRFCGQPGASKEHILGRWIGRTYTADPPPGLSFHLRHETVTPDGTLKTTKTAKGTAFVTRAFCESCNTGWMARLEDRVKPVLGAMLLRRVPLTLSVDDQAVLALWATKTALASQTQEPHDSMWARAEDFRGLYDKQAPLPGSQVWIGAREQWHPAMYRGHSTALHGSEDLDGFGAVVSVRFAVMWVLVPSRPRPPLRLFGPSAMAMKPIWPGLGRTVVWPPVTAIDGTDLTDLPRSLLVNSRLA